MDDFWTTILMVMISRLAECWISDKQAYANLQSGNNFRYLDFIFDIFMKFVKFMFYFCFFVFFIQHECVIRNLISKSFPKIIEASDYD